MPEVLHTCSPTCCHSPSLKRARSPELTIDFHCHLLTPAVESLVAAEPQKVRGRSEQMRLMGVASVLHNEQIMGPPAARRMLSVEERLSDMDAMGVDRQVVSPTPTQYYYWAAEDLSEQLCKLQNEHIAATCGRYPDRLHGLGTVSLQYPQLAAAQLRFIVRTLGLHGVEISSAAAGMELSDPALDVFWAEASALKCIVFLHPLGTSLGERVNTHYLANIIGQPLETTIALSKLIFDGVFDRHPGFRLVAAHGGGYLASYLGRTQHAAQVRPEVGPTKALPSEYLRRIWVDSVVHDPKILRHLIETVGISQLVVGTDYPYDMGCYDVHECIAAIPGLSPEERKQILGGNAARLLGLEHIERP